MMPRIHKKEFSSRHICPECSKTMQPGEFIIEFLGDVWMNQYKYRFAHLECVLKKSPDAVQKRGLIADGLRRKIQKQIFMEAI